MVQSQLNFETKQFSLSDLPHDYGVDDCLKLLKQLKDLLVSYEDSIYQALAFDLRKPRLEAYGSEIAMLHHEIDLFLAKLKEWRRPKRVASAWWTIAHFSARSQIYPEPKGRVLVIGPWNYPFHLSLLPVIGAFAAGNQVVLKPSELAPATSALLKKIINQWLPQEVAQVIEGDANVSEALLKEKWGHVFFTGGTETGRKIMRACSDTLSPVTLELGGKSPCFMDEEVSLERALKRILWGKFYNAGQTCVAPDYLLVPAKRLEQTISLSRNILSGFYGANPQESSDYARIINENHFHRIERLKTDGKIVVGGKSDIKDKFIEPTLLTEVSLQGALMKEEIFGPLLPLIPYQGLGEALSIILEREKPLAFYIFSEDQQRIETLKKTVSAGGICINDTLVHLGNLELPFGGIGDSGMGAYHGYESFRTFTHFKSIEQKSLQADISMRYPPYKIKLNRFLKKFV